MGCSGRKRTPEFPPVHLSRQEVNESRAPMAFALEHRNLAVRDPSIRQSDASRGWSPAKQWSALSMQQRVVTDRVPAGRETPIRDGLLIAPATKMIAAAPRTARLVIHGGKGSNGASNSRWLAATRAGCALRQSRAKRGSRGLRTRQTLYQPTAGDREDCQPGLDAQGEAIRHASRLSAGRGSLPQPTRLSGAETDRRFNGRNRVPISTDDPSASL